MNSQDILRTLKSCLDPFGLEVYLFKLAWYNEQVESSFQFKYNGDTVCAVILSTPSFFEKTFLPYLSDVKGKNLVKDPIDSCISHHMSKVKSQFPHIETSVMFDYERLPNGRPKVLVQTAAHVAGAAFYYQRKDILQNHLLKKESTARKSEILNEVSTRKDPVQNNISSILEDTVSSTDTGLVKDEMICNLPDPWDNGKNIYGVCIHPLYGGWFAIRCVIIFKDLKDAKLIRCPPQDCVPSRTDRIELLNRFNNNWQDWTYRDIFSVKEKYSELQQKYFITPPKHRLKLLSDLGYI